MKTSTSMSKTITPAMYRALEKAAQPGGHGYGENAYLSRTTAQALADRGLAELSTRLRHGKRGLPWICATTKGRDELATRREAFWS